MPGPRISSSYYRPVRRRPTAWLAGMCTAGAVLAAGCAAAEPNDPSSVGSPVTASVTSSALEWDPGLGVVGYWSFDNQNEPGAESSGESSAAQVVNATWTADGRSGGALYFNGSNAVVTALDDGWNRGSPVTYNLWYKSEGAATGYVLEHEWSTARSGAFAVDARAARFRMYDSSRRPREQSYGPVGADRWTMLSIVVDGGTIRVYRDGTRISSMSRTLARRSGPLDIGASAQGRDSFRGWIDEVGVFGRALSDAEIREIHGAYDAPPTPTGPDNTWSPLSVLSVTNPMDFGATGDGLADDLGALQSAVEALPDSGGIVYLPSGKSFRKTDILEFTKNHVKFWAINREAEVFSSIAGQIPGQPGRQAIACRVTAGCGAFGLKLRSDAKERFYTPEDAQLANDQGTLVEYVGNEIDGAGSVGIMLFASTQSYVEGNYVHHTWADTIHHTMAANSSWVWGNTMFNEAPPLGPDGQPLRDSFGELIEHRGDDGIACVTYGPTSPRCRDMEWWNNVVLHSDWGRGYSVIGGENIHIHDNWAIGVAAAGIIVASESSFDTASSRNIRITRNYVVESGHYTMSGHPGFLISAGHDGAEPLQDITLDGNFAVGNHIGPYRAEPSEEERPGRLVNVVNLNMSEDASMLPPRPTSPQMADTRVLRTRDVSHVPVEARHGLYRIHVRLAPAGAGFEQRFEYLISGEPSAVTAFVQTQQAAGAYLSEQRTVGDAAYALLLVSAPVVVPNTLSAVGFVELRDGDRGGQLSWLWNRVDRGDY